MSTLRRRVSICATAVIAAGLAAGTALAAVSGTPQVAANGNAGYDAVTTAPAGFTDVQNVTTPDQYGLTIKSGAAGVQLCNSVSNFGAQIGLLSTNLTTVYSVASGTGTIPSTGCPTGGVLPGGVVFPGLAAVPYGHSVWVNEYLVTKVRKVRVLICYVPGKPKPEESPSPAPSPSSSVTGTPSPSVTPSPTSTASGTPSPTSTATTTAMIWKHPKPKYTCVWVTLTRPKNVVVFEAQDLDATGTAGDVAGVQSRTVPVPAGTVFNHADTGVNENLTSLVACSGLAADGNTYPLALAGPAAYTTAACQPVVTEEYATATIGTGTPQDFASLDTTEGIAPSSTGALVAPNNSISTVNTGPHGSASDASTAGSHLELFTGNAPTS